MIENYVLHTAVYTCDRCGGETRGQGQRQEVANAAVMERTGTLKLTQFFLVNPKRPENGGNRSFPIGDEEKHIICGDCVKSLLEWWTSVDVPA